MANPKLLPLLAVYWLWIILPFALAGTNEEGLKYLEENKSKPGVITLESGLQYKVLEEGTGNYHPAVDSPCLCHYEGKLIDGTVFDSSYERGDPITFAPNQVIKGWTEAMTQLMVEGDKYELTIPSELAYGDSGSPPKIPGGSVLVFTMELISISGDIADFVPAARCDAKTREKCDEKEMNYLDKIASWTDDKVASELSRLKTLIGEARSMKPELAVWIKKRLHLLQQLNNNGSEETE